MRVVDEAETSTVHKSIFSAVFIPFIFYFGSIKKRFRFFFCKFRLYDDKEIEKNTQFFFCGVVTNFFMTILIIFGV